MNEIFDRLLVRIFLVFFVCLLFWAYKYAHFIFYPALRRQITKIHDPSENPADTIHLFARICGLSIVISALNFDETSGFFLSLFHFISWGILTSIIYLISLYLVETIVLYNFEYKDEILKRKNMVFALISMTHSFSIAYLIKEIIKQSENSFIILLILWLMSMVVLGFMSKYFSYLSSLNLKSLISQKNLSIAFAYLGYTLGMTFLYGECLEQEHYDVTIYCIQVLLKILLCLIIYPLFKFGLTKMFRTKTVSFNNKEGEAWTLGTNSVGYGLLECFLFLTSSVLTSLIVNQIHFGTIYPFF